MNHDEAIMLIKRQIDNLVQELDEKNGRATALMQECEDLRARLENLQESVKKLAGN